MRIYRLIISVSFLFVRSSLYLSFSLSYDICVQLVRAVAYCNI